MTSRLHLRACAAFIAIAFPLLPLVALAQSAPPPGMPSYAVPVPATAPQPADEETIHGKIASIDDADSLQLNDDRGFIDSIKLQQDTVIHPRGTQLQPGMAVTIGGAARGAFFAARHIDVADAAGAPPPQPALPPQLAPTQQLAPPPPGPAFVQPAPIQLTPGMELTGTLGTSLDSKTAFVGEPVVLTDVVSANGELRGATLNGTVTDVQHPGQGHNAQISMHFDSLQLAHGPPTPIDGIVISMKLKTKSNAAKEVGGAVLGMLAGNAIGKTLFGVSGGGIVGAFGGYLVAKDNRTDVVIPANSDVTVRLVPARRQAL